VAFSELGEGVAKGPHFVVHLVLLILIHISTEMIK